MILIVKYSLANFSHSARIFCVIVLLLFWLLDSGFWIPDPLHPER